MNSEAEQLGPQVGARLGYLLKRAFLELEDLHAEHLAPFGVNARELTVLLFLDGREPESQQQAAARLRVDRTTMVGLLDGLEAKGLVARQADPRDRRRNVVALTEVGRQTLAQARAGSDEAERQLLGGLSSSEATQLRALLARVPPGRTQPEHSP
ncbi:MAG TPA: MarR family transcriptional regulator [Friedmanniella sp.]